MKKIRIRYNQERCIGCGACQVACKEQNGLMEKEFIRRVVLASKSTQNKEVQYPYSYSCNHCSRPTCVSVCPTGAMHKGEDGTILHDDALCIACGRCFWACPFGEVSFSRKSGLTQKCDNCLSLRERGREPKCVSFCPTGSLELEEIEIEEPEEEREEKKSRGSDRVYLILGGGAAGAYAAAAIREEDRSGRIVMLSADSHRPYRRPLLSKSPFRNLQARRFELFSEDFYERNNIELHLGERVLSLDTEKRCVSTDKGSYTYDRCIYALGAEAFIPPIPGRDKRGVHVLRTIEDVESIRRACLEGGDAVIIGGGVIGVELAFELQEYGINVTILEAMPRLMARQLDEDISSKLMCRLRAIGIRVETGVSIKEISGKDRVDGVVLSDGRVFPATLVVASCGIRANAQLASAAGVKCSRAVVVNDYMETSAKDVWACGDAAELDGVNYALYSQAMAEGETAGRNAAGRHLLVPAFDTSLVLNSRELNMFSIGDTGILNDMNYVDITREGSEGGFRINDRERSYYGKLVYLDGRVTGAALLGNLEDMEMLRCLVEKER